MSSRAYVFLGANTPWVYALATALAESGHSVFAIALYDYRTFLRLRPRWPGAKSPPSLRRAFWVMPPGYVGTLASVFAPLLRWRLARAIGEAGNSGSPWVVVPYPWFDRIVRDVPDGRLIYYNLDDYPLYQLGRRVRILQQEEKLLRRAALTLCLSQRQVDTLRARVSPDLTMRIRHFPLGVAESYINSHPESVPRARTVGYVGNLIDRVDWRLVAETARAMPDVEFIFVGRLEGFGGGGIGRGSETERAAALALPNVRRVGPVRQEEVPGHYCGFGVNWIPYATDHAFNRAACPTKIMDGLASGRPVVSTDVPECRLYPDWITVIHSASEACAVITSFLSGKSRNDPCEQVEFARQNTWKQRGRGLEQWLAD